MSYFIDMNKNAKELKKLGFSGKLYASPKSCENWLNHCKKYDMEFLKESYGTIVHKNFNKYFKHIPIKNDKQYEIQQNLKCGSGLEKDYSVENFDNMIFDHTNLLKSKITDDYFLTSSPYSDFIYELQNIKNYPYNVYVVHNNFLDYYAFIDNENGYLRHPLCELNYVFTKATKNNIKLINKTIYKDIGLFPVFLEMLI